MQIYHRRRFKYYYSKKIFSLGVGKSNILLQFTQKKFKVDHEITIGVEFGARNLEVDNKIFRIQVWDTVKLKLIK